MVGKFDYALSSGNNIDDIIRLSEKFSKKFNNFCLLGTGGSSLGAQALIGLIPEPRNKNFNFFCDIDPIFYQKSMNSLKLNKTGFIVVS